MLYYTRKWFKITAGEKMRLALNGAIENGLRAAGAKAVGDLREAVTDMDIKNNTIRRTIDYVGEYSPGALKHFGLSPDRLGDLVAARLPNFDGEV